GIMSAVRTMSPEYVICDEIADGGDVAALKYARSSGVAVMASAHADGVDSLFRSESIASLISAGVLTLCAGS
ncbi:MAG: hypothetical protein J6L71_02435, partial [Clostridia bacterium]|nr:hypothetical protein [Clostridia bacterium]